MTCTYAAPLGVRAHAPAPHVERVDDLPDLEVGQRGDGVGRVDDHLVRAASGGDGEEVRLGEGPGEALPGSSAG